MTLEPASLNGDAAGMNFTVEGDLPVGGKLQVEAIDVSCNDYIVETYFNGVELPEGTQMAFDLTILTENGAVFEPAPGNKITVTMSSNDGTELTEMAVYHLPGVTGKQVLGAVKAMADAAEAEAAAPASFSNFARTKAAAEPTETETQADSIRYYEVMNVDYFDGSDKRFFQFTTDGFSIYYIVAGTKNGNVEISENSEIYAMPGAEFTFADGFSIQNTNYNKNSFTVSTRNRSVSVSRSAVTGDTLILQFGYWWDRKTVTIIVKPQAYVVNGARTCPILLAVKIDTSLGIPNEPGDTDGYYLQVYKPGGSTYEATSRYDNFAANGENIIIDSIASNINFVSSVDGSATYGVYDASGAKTLEVLQDGQIDWNQVLDALVNSGETIIATDGTVLTADNKDQFKVIPYVVKYKTQDFRWHIDCAVVRKEFVTLTYFINFDGSQYVTTSLVLPNAVTVAKDSTVAVGAIKNNGTPLNKNDKIRVTDVNGTNGQTVELTFSGWNTKSDGTGTWYDPGSEITLPANTELYAMWNYKVVTSDLKISKTVETRANSAQAPANDSFAFAVTFADTAKHDYTIYDSTDKQLSTGSISTGETLSLQNGQYAVIKNVTVGNYTITENLTADQALYYTADSAEKSGTITAESVAEAAFKNTYAKYKLITEADDHSTVNPACPESAPQYYGYHETDTIEVEVAVKDSDKKAYDISKITIDGVELTGDAFDAIVAADGGTITVDKKNDHTVVVETVRVIGKLTITKTGSNDSNEGFIFNVVGTDEKTSGIRFTVSVQSNGSVTIADIPIGTYTVSEQKAWSWRYQTVTIENNGEVTLTSENYEVTVNVNNSNKNPYLLDGNAYKQNTSYVPSVAGN